MVTMSEAAKAGAANETATSNALSRDFMGASSLFLELYPPTAKLSPQSFCDRRGPQLLRPSEGLFEDRQRLGELLDPRRGLDPRPCRCYRLEQRPVREGRHDGIDRWLSLRPRQILGKCRSGFRRRVPLHPLSAPNWHRVLRPRWSSQTSDVDSRTIQDLSRYRRQWSTS